MIDKDLIWREYSAILNSKEGRGMYHQEALSKAIARVDDFELCLEHYLKKRGVQHKSEKVLFSYTGKVTHFIEHKNTPDGDYVSVTLACEHDGKSYSIKLEKSEELKLLDEISIVVTQNNY